jgi:TPR repeat protein
MADRPLGTAGFCVLSALLLVLTGPAFGDPMEDGTAAYQRKDFASAIGFWQPLADAGNAEAQDRIGSLYANGEGVTQDPAKAVDWFRKSADQGNAEAEWRLSLVYLRGGGPLTKDVPTGLAWLRKAADRDFAAADFTLATVYFAGSPPDMPQDFG